MPLAIGSNPIPSTSHSSSKVAWSLSTINIQIPMCEGQSDSWRMRLNSRAKLKLPLPWASMQV